MYESGTLPIAASGWAKPKGLGQSYVALDQDLSTDVLVIGAGLAGSSLALHLSEQGIDTVLLEARQPGWGASGRNAGHVLPLLKDFDVFEQFPDRLGQPIRCVDAQAMREMTGSDYYPYGVFYESGGRINPYLFTCGIVKAA